MVAPLRVPTRAAVLADPHSLAMAKRVAAPVLRVPRRAQRIMASAVAAARLDRMAALVAKAWPGSCGINEKIINAAISGDRCSWLWRLAPGLGLVGAFGIQHQFPADWR